MRKYKIIYREDGEQKSTLLDGANKDLAAKAFSTNFPNIGTQGIISVERASPSQGDTSSKDASYTSDYGTARGVAAFISFLGWLCFAIGLLVSLSAMGRGGIVAFLPGLSLAVSGLILVAAGQVTRATVDNADHTREILKVIKTQGETSPG